MRWGNASVPSASLWVTRWSAVSSTSARASARRWAAARASARASGRTAPAPRPAATKCVFSWLPLYRRAWLPIVSVGGCAKFSGGRKRSAGRLTPRFYGVAAADSRPAHQPVNLEASNFLTGRGVRVAPCVCVVAVDASSRPAGLCGLGQPASSRARVWDLAICLQYVSDGCTLHQRLLGAVCCSPFEHRGV